MVEAINLEPLIRRQLVWDLLPCAQAADSMSGLGLTPASKDVDDMEHRTSHRRLNTLIPIIGAVRLYSDIAGDVLGRSILNAQGYDVDNDEDPKLQHYKHVVMASSEAVIANLIAANVLHVSEGPIIL